MNTFQLISHTHIADLKPILPDPESTKEYSLISGRNSWIIEQCDIRSYDAKPAFD